MQAKVLVVEDNPIDQMAIRRALEERGFPHEVTFASSTAEAKARLLAHDYDVVVADYLLGDGTAFDLFRFAMRAPVIVITGVGDEETAIRAMKAGAQDYLVKDKSGEYLKLLPERLEATLHAGGVEAQAQLLARALLRTQNAVFLTDLAGTILFANTAFRRRYGYSSEEILGKPASQLGEEGADGLVVYRRKDGSSLPAFLHSVTLRDEEGADVVILHFLYPERPAETVERSEEGTPAEHLALEERMIEALQNEEFLLHYQPIFRLADGRMTSLEALLRWKNPRFGLVMPIQFIPALERSGFILRVGEWVLRKVLQQMRDWQRLRYPQLPIGVNLAPLQFLDPGLVGMIERLLREFTLPRELLILEIKESTLVANPARGRSILAELQQHSIRTCLDNAAGQLGEAIGEMPMDMIKLDVGLVQNMDRKKAALEQVKLILATARQHQLCVIAKGLETKEQLETLNLLGCEMGQGFYYQLPLPVRDLERLLVESRGKEGAVKR
ncbi:MAG: EAL domain-containing protein [Coprothermobacterota bacterium]|nr:EAL domain-containing protein [Coprothermobacterota bacterium]